MEAYNHNIRQLVEKEIFRKGWDADLNHIDVSRVTNMDYLFYFNAHFIGDISKWNVSNLLTARGMFYCSQFNNDISSWNVERLADSSLMFAGSRFNQDISEWKLYNLRDAERMFLYSYFNKSIDKWSEIIYNDFVFEQIVQSLKRIKL